VTIDPVQTGIPPFKFVDRIGKVADKPCNDIIKLPIPTSDIFFHDEPLIKCGKP
jgi:hypothetical protein